MWGNACPNTERCRGVSFPIRSCINVAHIWSRVSQRQRGDNTRTQVITTAKFTDTAYCTELLQIRPLCLIKTPDSRRHHKHAILWLNGKLTGGGTQTWTGYKCSYEVPYDRITKIKTEKLGLSCQNSGKTLKIGKWSIQTSFLLMTQPYKWRAQSTDFHSAENRWTNVCVLSLPLLSHHHSTLPFPRPPLWLMCHSAQHNVLLSLSWQSILGAAMSALWPLEWSILMETSSVMVDAAWI